MTARPPAPLVFNHIPKTAGTSLQEALASALHLTSGQVFEAMDRSTFAGFTDFAALTAAARRRMVFDSAQLPRNVGLVTGHLAPSTTFPRFPDSPHMTVLREPRSRVLSLWLFQRAHTDFMLRRWDGFARWFAVADTDLTAAREHAFATAVARYEAALRQPAHTPAARRVVERLYDLRAKLPHRRR